MTELTETRERVFGFVRNALAAGHPAPTMREIAAAFGWAGKRAAEKHVNGLVQSGWLMREAGKARSLRLAKALPMVVAVPLLGSIPAGFSDDQGQNEGECIPVTIESIGFTPTRNTFALRVVGDSMIGRHICDGDIAVCEHGPEPRDGQIVAALIDRKNTLKTFLMRRGKPVLKAENSKYPNLIPAEELVIQGVVRAVIRRMKE